MDRRLAKMVSDMGKTTIINLHSKGLSKRKIANTLGIARNTVKRYLREYEEAKARIDAAEGPVEKARIQKSALEAPRMDTSGRKPRVFGGELERRFNELYEADFDFRQAKVTIAGSPRVVHQATISRPASNHVFVALCEDETMASVEKALIAFFEECGGVFGEVAFDNLKPVVANAINGRLVIIRRS